MNTSTCIIGYNDRKNRKLYIGGDSAGVSSNYIRIRKDNKVFKKSNMLFGFTSSFRMGQLLKYKLIIPIQSKSKSDFNFLVTDFIDALKNCLKENNYATLSNNVLEGGTFIIGYKGELYTIYSDFQVAKVYDNYTAIGCGTKYALGALKILDKQNIETRKKIKQSLQVASYFSTGVKPPFNIKKIRY